MLSQMPIPLAWPVLCKQVDAVGDFLGDAAGGVVGDVLNNVVGDVVGNCVPAMAISQKSIIPGYKSVLKMNQFQK